MAKAGYSVSTSADVALVAATAKTVLAVLAPATFGVDLRGFEIAFDGVTTTDKPVLIEVCTLHVRRRTRRRARRTRTRTRTSCRSTGGGHDGLHRVLGVDVGADGARAGEDLLRLTPNGGTYDYDWPLGETYDNDVSKGFAVRCTAPTSAVNVRASFRFERC
jgi:hypothetical protein